MKLLNYYIKPFKYIFDFNGKSSLKEFWLFFLINIIVSIFIGIIRGLTGYHTLREIFLIITLLPFIALGFRRLNDAGITKWLFLIPFVNLVLACFPKKKERY
ncbi:DUF805 domain-containing protein [Aequorivita viscosa]|uniref:Uncharacterized membrane protein YhaH, DUF805 family n=1 Tax=Aequorivita viscosa TaxID=797419 RepID=A0A1M6PBH3_9FLAO|nr:Uncharacterized membrane protein YhaH, DUF805 family [Aequorivita viscosa]SHK05319.1 Uncharacterized membrane protein YhaH, DUF805 family [Aequorivita viscosa]